jgi:hypothetical protein
MKWSSTLWTLLFTVLFSPFAMAQLNCEYSIIMIEDFGDTWNGATVTVTVDGNAEVFAITTSGTELEVASFPVQDGATFTVEFAGGIFDYEIYYAIVDSDGNIVFEDGEPNNFVFPTVGLVYEGTISCPSCPAPPSSSVDIENIRAFTADVSWVPSDPLGDYVIEYGTTGFAIGTGLTKTISAAGSTTLFNLEENTNYELYLTSFCANGDTSITVGPYPFQTLYAIDVGVSSITNPVTGCALGANDTIRLTISNFGGLPQSLIPFDYSVNGIPGGVSMPQDGLFTAVVGTDSTEVTEFDATFDFSEPGEYVIEVWTALEGDSVLTNDTTSIRVVSIPLITEYPYFDDLEEWFGGWTVEANGFGPSSWEYGVPSAPLINSAVSGSNAWVTNINGDYNNSELSYLISPCLDFTSLLDDPRIGFNIFFDSESCCDEAWVDISLDNGETWTKVGDVNTGVNWYNDAGNQWWDGTGGFEGWAYAQNILEGSAGEPEVRIRFVFSSDGSVVREGIALDNIFIAAEVDEDFAATGLMNDATAICGSENDPLSITITNVGATPQANYDLSYSINGGPVTTESVTMGVLPGASFSYTFMDGFDSSTPGVYEIQAWVDLPGDDVNFNDTISITYRTATETPFREDFEAGAIPNGWLTDFNVIVSNGHNNASQVMHANLDQFSPTTSMTTPVVGPISMADTLTFDYRFVDFFAGTEATILADGDSLIVELSTDCGETFDEVINITAENHTPTTALTTIKLPLEAYADSTLSVRFRGVWGNGDYYLDLDNINIFSCPDSLGLTAEVTQATTQVEADGAISIVPLGGVGPYTYDWSNGASGKTIEGLQAGLYKVTVTDVFGCQDELEVLVDVVSSIEDPIQNIAQLTLAPNPTKGTSFLNIRFKQPMNAQIQLLNTVGQLIFEANEQKVTERTYELDLSQYNSGLYLVRVIAEGEMQTAKLIKVR